MEFFLLIYHVRTWHFWEPESFKNPKIIELLLKHELEREPET